MRRVENFHCFFAPSSLDSSKLEKIFPRGLTATTYRTDDINNDFFIFVEMNFERNNKRAERVCLKTEGDVFQRTVRHSSQDWRCVSFEVVVLQVVLVLLRPDSISLRFVLKFGLTTSIKIILKTPPTINAKIDQMRAKILVKPQ